MRAIVVTTGLFSIMLSPAPENCSLPADPGGSLVMWTECVLAHSPQAGPEPRTGGCGRIGAGGRSCLVPVSVAPGRSGLDLGPEWTRRWTATWRTAGDEVACSVRDLAHTRIADATPMRWFS